MAAISVDYAQYCAELLGSLGPIARKRLFGGFALSCRGLTVAILADLGQGPTLWLKAARDNAARFEREGCARFTYLIKGSPKSLWYFSAPLDAMESPSLMDQWARLAWESALGAKSA